VVGQTLGHYEIVEKIGAGGMGEVYRARDTRLERTVALKILPKHFAASDELRQRFEREAKVISSLTHPHICTLHDVGHVEGTDFLVMEYLEGETLAVRLQKGRLPADQVLRFGREIASALDRAHRGGIVHRDLKPGNIMLTKDGVKLLDFGLAKVRPEGGLSDTTGPTALATEAAGTEPLTEKGTVLGTFRYMAPEQLEGEEADARTDIFALGAVLYEMATGRRAFEGKSQASLIAAILEREPEPISTLEPMTPPALDWTVRRCLAKDPDERWQSAGDIAGELMWIAEDSSRAGVPVRVSRRRRQMDRLAWGLVAVLALALILIGVRQLGRAPRADVVTRFEIHPPPGLVSVGPPSISPDGLHLAFNATDSSGVSRVWLRSLASLEVRALLGTEEAHRPFWSPDSRHLAFFADDKLKQVSVAGGHVQTICTSVNGADGVWGSEGVILFDGWPGDPIYRVPETGGEPEPATKLDSSGSEIIHCWPEFLPDGRHFLFLTFLRGRSGEGELVLGTLDSDELVPLGDCGSRMRYSPSGHLLYVEEQQLIVRPFSAEGLAFTGDPATIAVGIRTGMFGRAAFSLSGNGLLAYSTGSAVAEQLAWLNREGELLETLGPVAGYDSPELSPDDRWIAVGRGDVGSVDDEIWVIDSVRGTSTRFTFNPTTDAAPVWSSDGRSLIFGSTRMEDTPWGLFRRPFGAAGVEDTLLMSAQVVLPSQCSRDGDYLVYHVFGPRMFTDIYAVAMSGDGAPTSLVATDFDEGGGRLSPNGRWLAYHSDESGDNEIYVRPFPEPGGKWQVSSAGGYEPEWRGDGMELYYLAPGNRLMAVPVETEGEFKAGSPEPLFTVNRGSSTFGGVYDVAQDGERFLFILQTGEEEHAPFTVVLNWPAELRE
jgi:serine/threonine protein kinase